MRQEIIEKIAYYNYLKHKDSNDPARDWVEAEFIYNNKIRLIVWSFRNLWSEATTIIRYGYGAFYFITGLLLLVLFSWPKSLAVFTGHKEMLWCFGWAFLGVGCGLINSRYDDVNKGKKEEDKQKNKGGHMHYILYFSFVIFIATLAALSMTDNNNIKFYVISALIAIVVGFTGDKLVDKIFELRK